MLYIGLSTKEISSITFREVRSIESARNRLRKKLEVPADETIQEFLSRKLGNMYIKHTENGNNAPSEQALNGDTI
jgi:hypothetical protein